MGRERKLAAPQEERPPVNTRGKGHQRNAKENNPERPFLIHPSEAPCAGTSRSPGMRCGDRAGGPRGRRLADDIKSLKNVPTL